MEKPRPDTQDRITGAFVFLAKSEPEIGDPEESVTFLERLAEDTTISFDPEVAEFMFNGERSVVTSEMHQNPIIETTIYPDSANVDLETMGLIAEDGRLDFNFEDDYRLFAFQNVEDEEPAIERAFSQVRWQLNEEEFPNDPAEMSLEGYIHGDVFLDPPALPEPDTTAE
jgi:hypothetical protein